MWFFMNTCYLMSFVTFICMITAFFQSFLRFNVFMANHVTFIILTSIVYLFTETLVIFFFVGIGVSVKEYTADKKLDQNYYKRVLGIKRRIYPPLLLNMLIMIILFILVGAVDTYRFPVWAYALCFLGGILHYVKVKIIQHECFKENTGIVLEMSGVQRSFA